MVDRKISIIVASHKSYWFPSDSMYLPVQVGSRGKAPIPGLIRDDQGDNISSLNSRYCELTGLWWAWKNISSDSMGLVHYRRYFAGSGEKGILTSHEANEMLDRAPLVLPKKRHYVIETNEDHYVHTHGSQQLEALRIAVEQVCPDCMDELDRHLKERSGHMLNMLLAESNTLDNYLTWLFPILRTAERYIDFEGLSSFEQRCVGRLSELLLDVWVTHTMTPFVECSIRDMEPVNWLKKGSAFLAAKYFGKKYERSF